VTSKPRPWCEPDELTRLYDRARRRSGAGGPLLQVFRTLDPGTEVPADAAASVEWLFGRALERCRFPPPHTLAAIAVRVDIELAPTTATEATIVVRVFDTGPIADPKDVPELDERPDPRFDVRRQPPAGTWSGGVALRIPVGSERGLC